MRPISFRLWAVVIRYHYKLMQSALRRALPLPIALCAVSLLPACKSVEVPKVPGVTPYRMVIQQGNFISQEMVEQLKPGMTREQVRFVLGTPLVADIFHADRWDYVFFRELPNGKREQRNLSVVFEKDKLARVLGDLMPADAPAPQSTGFAPQVKPEAPKPAAKAKEDEKKAAEQKKAAEEKRIAAEKKLAEEKRLADEKRAAEEKNAADAKKTAEERRAAETKQAGEEKKEPGFFGRLLEKITPAKATEPRADAKPAAEAVNPAAVEADAKDAKPAEGKERGFFGRMLEKIGL